MLNISPKFPCLGKNLNVFDKRSRFKFIFFKIFARISPIWLLYQNDGHVLENQEKNVHMPELGQREGKRGFQLLESVNRYLPIVDNS